MTALSGSFFMAIEQRPPILLQDFLSRYELEGQFGLRTTLELMERFAHVPRPSGRERPMGDLLMQIARENGLEAIMDNTICNVVIYHPGSPGHENDPGMILQAHQDMICKADKGKLDPAVYGVTPIVVYRHGLDEGGWIATDGTSGGFDDSAGAAQSLAYA